MNNEIRYDTIQWSCDFDNSRINVTAYDLDNQADIAKKMTFKEVLGMITDDGNGNHIDVTQEVFFWNKKGEPVDEEQSHKFGTYAFFAEITGRENEPWMTPQSIKEYKELTDKAVYELLHGIINPVILK